MFLCLVFLTNTPTLCFVHALWTKCCFMWKTEHCSITNKISFVVVLWSFGLLNIQWLVPLCSKGRADAVNNQFESLMSSECKQPLIYHYSKIHFTFFEYIYFFCKEIYFSVCTNRQPVVFIYPEYKALLAGSHWNTESLLFAGSWSNLVSSLVLD